MWFVIKHLNGPASGYCPSPETEAEASAIIARLKELEVGCEPGVVLEEYRAAVKVYEVSALNHFHPDLFAQLRRLLPTTLGDVRIVPFTRPPIVTPTVRDSTPSYLLEVKGLNVTCAGIINPGTRQAALAALENPDVCVTVGPDGTQVATTPFPYLGDMSHVLGKTNGELLLEKLRSVDGYFEIGSPTRARLNAALVSFEAHVRTVSANPDYYNGLLVTKVPVPPTLSLTF
jgi:hypothetical protein